MFKNNFIAKSKVESHNRVSICRGSVWPEVKRPSQERRQKLSGAPELRRIKMSEREWKRSSRGAQVRELVHGFDWAVVEGHDAAWLFLMVADSELSLDFRSTSQRSPQLPSQLIHIFNRIQHINELLSIDRAVYDAITKAIDYQIKTDNGGTFKSISWALRWTERFNYRLLCFESKQQSKKQTHPPSQQMVRFKSANARTKLLIGDRSFMLVYVTFID